MPIFKMKNLYLTLLVNIFLCSVQTKNFTNAILPGDRGLIKRNIRMPFARIKSRREPMLRNDHFRINEYPYDLAQKQFPPRYLEEEEPYYLNANQKIKHDYDFYKVPRDPGHYRMPSYNSPSHSNYGYLAKDPVDQNQEDVFSEDELIEPSTYFQIPLLEFILALILFLVVVSGIKYHKTFHKKLGAMKPITVKKKEQKTLTASTDSGCRGILVASNEEFDKAAFLKKMMNGKKREPAKDTRVTYKPELVEDEFMDMIKEKKDDTKKAPKSKPTVRFNSVINDDPLLFRFCQLNSKKASKQIF